MKKKKQLYRVAALVLAMLIVLTLAACKPDNPGAITAAARGPAQVAVPAAERAVERGPVRTVRTSISASMRYSTKAITKSFVRIAARF